MISDGQEGSAKAIWVVLIAVIVIIGIIVVAKKKDRWMRLMGYR